MNKREVVWLIVRLIGVYFSYSAIVAALALFGAIWAIVSLPSRPADTTDVPARVEGPVSVPGFGSNPPNPTAAPSPKTPANRTDTASDLAKREAFKLILWHLFLTVLQGGIGFYLVRYGSIFFNILVRENKPGEVKEKEPESILLNLS